MPVYTKDFEPIAQPRENICIIGAKGEGSKKYYKVLGIEPLPLLEHDFGPISAGEKLTDQEVKDLYLDDSQLAQYRIRLVDDVTLILKQPKSTTKFTTREGTFKITRDIAGTDFTNLTEFYIFEDTSVFFTVINNGTTNLTSSKVQFAGFKYYLEELDCEPDKYTVVVIQM